MNEVFIKSPENQCMSDELQLVHFHVATVIDKLKTTIDSVFKSEEISGRDILPHWKNLKFYRLEVSKIIDNISEYDGYENGITAIHNLINLIGEDNGNGGDFLRTLNIVTRRIKQLIAETFESIDHGKKLVINDKYSTDVVGGGIFIKKTSIQNKGDKIIDIDVFNENIYGLEFHVLIGGKIILDLSLDKMKDDKNYCHPDLFGAKDVEKLSSMIRKSYIGRKSDIGEVVLKTTFSNFMSDKGRLLFMKNRSNELMSTLFIEESDNGFPHIWTIYIDEKYQSGFGLAALMQVYGLNLTGGKNAKLLSVLGSLPMEIYINNMGYVGASISGEVKGIPTTEQMLELVLDRNKKYETKNISLDQLILHCEVEDGLQDNDKVKFITLEEKNLNALSSYLKEGYEIIKIFSINTKYYIGLESFTD